MSMLLMYIAIGSRYNMLESRMSYINMLGLQRIINVVYPLMYLCHSVHAYLMPNVAPSLVMCTTACNQREFGYEAIICYCAINSFVCVSLLVFGMRGVMINNFKVSCVLNPGGSKQIVPRSRSTPICPAVTCHNNNNNIILPSKLNTTL